MMVVAEKLPAWLVNARIAIDKAVATAYGWTDYSPETPDSELLARLLSLNEERSRMGEIRRICENCMGYC
jgi:hypothetical protein